MVKRLYRRGGRGAPCAENPACRDLEVADGDGLAVWAVVVGKFKRLL